MIRSREVRDIDPTYIIVIIIIIIINYVATERFNACVLWKLNILYIIYSRRRIKTYT